MIKRHVSLLLAAMMLFSLAGCGSTSDSTEAKGGFYKVCGVYYPEELGAPVLGEAAGELVSQEFTAAAEQITNVGDALYYLKASGLTNHPDCSYLADLLATDYDEVGLIYLATSDGGFSTLVYVKVGDTYYPINPNFEDASWLHGSKKDYVSDTNLDALREKLASARPGPIGIKVTSNAIPVYLNSELDPNYEPSTNIFAQEEGPVNPSAKTKGGYNSIIDFYRIPADSGKPQYSEEEIKELVAADLTLDEAAEKLSTLADVVQYLYLRGYHCAKSGDLKFEYFGCEWATNRSAQVVFNENAGNCGGGSNLLNYLLQGDYDEQGYVQESANPGGGGHIYNYFKQDGVYFFCDMTQIVYEDTYANHNYSIFATEDPFEFSKYYVGENHKYLADDEPHYLRLQYMYPCEGDSHQPVGMTSFMQLLPTALENSIMILYSEEEPYAPIFVDAPPVELWPEEAQ